MKIRFVGLWRLAVDARNVSGTLAPNVFVISLCINDLCTLFFVVLVIIDSYVWRRWRAGDVMCRLNPELTVAFTGCTLWHTALIAVHRYLVVVHRNAYHRISKRAYNTLIMFRSFYRKHSF